jgi:hypothetical protein
MMKTFDLTTDTRILVEAMITAFSFVRLFKDRVEEYWERNPPTDVWRSGAGDSRTLVDRE